MSDPISRFIRGIVTAEIKRIIARNTKSGSILSADQATAEVLTTYPRCGIEKRALANEIVLTAAAAGLAIELGPVARRPGTSWAYKVRRAEQRPS
jgi:hypothetical protein